MKMEEILGFWLFQMTILPLLIKWRRWYFRLVCLRSFEGRLDFEHQGGQGVKLAFKKFGGYVVRFWMWWDKVGRSLRSLEDKLLDLECKRESDRLRVKCIKLFFFNCQKFLYLLNCWELELVKFLVFFLLVYMSKMEF